jgi:type I restriction enzyme S subunit
MQHQYFIRESRSQVSEQRVVDYTPIQYGDVLFAGSGETIEEIGKSAVNLISRHACCGGDVIIFRSQIEVDASFLGYATDCPQAAHQKSCMGRGITVMHIYGDELKYMWVAIPPISEQAAIGRCLNEANADIAAATDRARRQIDLLKEYRTRLIADVVTGKLDVREAATGLPEVDLLADEFDVLTEAPETGMMELEDANETPEELAMENEATV